MKITSTVTRIPDIKIKTPNKDFFQTTGLEAVTQIVKRTQAGKDVNGASFKPYKESYAEYRRGKARQAVPVNLTFSAKMLNAIKNEATASRARIYITGIEGVKAWGNTNKGRRFFDLSQDQLNSIITKVDKFVTAKNGLK